ncbi:hypothetical protein [Rhizobium lentis]|uniref:Uncharacterized protein n=1 Tax=Rhizobium lentis TaxID=1138194 RepID=A0A7W8XEI4_9HYPH|nr:hypothetical protein [Rhizobium lentis]MBB4574418.1 hypothetical protein [Rhizobium lentis]MBB5550344.1 hypothetical protein [Rhizobium lentis]MBB5560627.1 hypothetical protein [Rhizobium lentis]MBB5567212.1 hypothetical protein [Rhizobium lentis]
MRVTEPGLNRDGRSLLYRAAQFFARHGRAYPLALDSDRRGAEVAVAGGYVRRLSGDRHFVTVTEKGRGYLDALMRAE